MIEQAIRDGLRQGVAEKLRYFTQFNELLAQAFETQKPKLRRIIDEVFNSCLDDPQFRADLAEELRHKLSKTLVQRFGGEMEKQVNVLKSDPLTRARITLAIEQIVKERSVATA
jgi:hypothetical protein